MMWPAKRLTDGGRYIVAMRKLQTNSGDLVASSTAFAALRDNIPSSDPDVESRRARYNSDIFPKLQAAGFTRESIQLAWDFTVMSTHTLTSAMLTMREDAFQRVSKGIEYVIDQVHDNPSSSIARRLKGRMKVPWYLNKVSTFQIRDIHERTCTS